MRKVAILLFDEVDVLDFAGPFEVFSIAGCTRNLRLFEVYTIGEKPNPIQARNQLTITPRFCFNDFPQPEVLVVPGGYGTRKEMNNPSVVPWVRDVSRSAELVLSVCTGALILAKAGLLDGLKATTHHGALELLRKTAPNTEVLANRRVVDNGKIICSAGVSAGIDMAFHTLGRLHGVPEAVETARYIEYDWAPPV